MTNLGKNPLSDFSDEELLWELINREGSDENGALRAVLGNNRTDREGQCLLNDSVGRRLYRSVGSVFFLIVQP